MRTSALIKRICLQMVRDKRTLALLFAAPLLILTLMYFLFNGNAVNPKLGVVNVPTSLTHVLEKENVQVIPMAHATNDTMTSQNLDGLLEMNTGKIKLTLENDNPSTAKALQIKVSQAVAAQMQSKLMEQPSSAAPPVQTSIQTNYVYGNSDTSFFDVLSPILVGYFVFFFVFLISGIGLLKERMTGTLERLMSTPVRRGEIVLAYLTGFGIFAVIQTIIVVLYAVHVLDIAMVGSIWIVMLINLLLALVALSLGTLLSTFAASEFQMVQFIPIAVIPQIFFAGIFPLEGMANWLQAIARIMPMYYGADALKNVMYKGLGFSDISGDILALVLFAAIFIILNVLALKRYRTL